MSDPDVDTDEPIEIELDDNIHDDDYSEDEEANYEEDLQNVILNLDELTTELDKRRTEDAFQSKQSQYCAVCAEEDVEVFGGSCGHFFCASCWSLYSIPLIRNGLPTIKCMDFECRKNVPYALLKHLLKEELLEKHLLNETKLYEDLKPCVSEPFCYNTIKLNNQDKELQCSCGKKFCVECCQHWHYPATCEMNMKWTDKSRDETLSTLWIEEFTKACPKCKTTIEKNGGCDKMICRKCAHHFYWSCVAPMPKTKTTIEFSSLAIIAYNKCCMRSTFHRQYITTQHQKHIQVLTEKLEEFNILDRYDWAFDTFDQVLNAREFLMSCYCFVYYTFELEAIALKKTKKKLNDFEARLNIFDYHLELMEDIIQRITQIIFYIAVLLFEKGYNEDVKEKHRKTKLMVETLVPQLNNQKEGIHHIVSNSTLS